MKVVSAGVGAVLLTASFSLAYLSSNSADKMIEKQNAIVMKYVNDSKKALENKDLKSAKKFAKKAIQADANNKAGFKIYEEVLKAKYKPVELENSSTTVNSVVVPAQSSPQNDEEEEDEEAMGC